MVSAARLCLICKDSRFAVMRQALSYIDSRLRIPTSKYAKQSRILKQKRLREF